MPVIYGQSSIGRTSVAVPQREHVPQEPAPKRGSRRRAVLVDGVRYGSAAAAADAIGPTKAPSRTPSGEERSPCAATGSSIRGSSRGGIFRPFFFKIWLHPGESEEVETAKAVTR